VRNASVCGIYSNPSPCVFAVTQVSH
jgi:hypothetical protein